MKNLRQLFDYQRFEGNERLSKMIADTESRYITRQALDEDDLFMVNAAGSQDYFKKEEKESQVPLEDILKKMQKDTLGGGDF